MLEILDLQVQYGNKKILNGLSFDVHEGEIVGILGKNGAGKTTALKAIVGMKEYVGGEINYDKNLVIGYVPEKPEIYEYLTGYDFLRALGMLRNVDDEGIKAVEEWIGKYLELPNLNALISTLSKGNLEKIILFQAIIGFPEILVLDEPFTGLDAQSFVGAKQLLRDYANQNKMVILSTHVVEMCAQLCNRVVMLNDGFSYDHINLEESQSLESKICTLESLLRI